MSNASDDRLGRELLGRTAADPAGAPYADPPANEPSEPHYNSLPDGVKGDVLIHNGTEWIPLVMGLAGDVLAMGADDLPVWETPHTPS